MFPYVFKAEKEFELDFGKVFGYPTPLVRPKTAIRRPTAGRLACLKPSSSVIVLSGIVHVTWVRKTGEEGTLYLVATSVLYLKLRSLD